MSEDKVKSTDIDDSKSRLTSRREALKYAGLTGLAALGSGVIGTNAMASEGSSQDSKAQTEFSGKSVFITGGARGIGFATAEAFAKDGANIVLFDICKDIRGVGYPLAKKGDLKNAKEKIESWGVNCLAIEGDVRSLSELESAMKATIKNFGSLDVLFVNAGVTQFGLLDTFNDEEISAVLDINVAGVIKTTQAALPIMRKQKSGRIIYISSMLGRRGDKDWPIYSASKWAVIGLAKSTAHLMAEHNVMCNVICPTLVHTKLIDNAYILNKWMPHSPTFEAVEKLLSQFNPIPRGAYQPDEIAGVVKLFSGAATAQITGEVFDIQLGANATASA
jgi:NAD(P)-dependent dehydrogenase (short-subunit alcohol dehydrogenase family)